MSTYYERYSRDLSRINAMRMMMAQQGAAMQPPGPMDIALDVISRGRKVNPSVGSPQATLPKGKGPGGLLGAIEKAMPFAAPGAYLLKEGSETSPGKAVMDVLSRGTYASASGSQAFNRDGLGAVPEGFWKGLSGQNKITYSDVIAENDPDSGNFQRGAVGLAGDIFADPTTYIPVAGLIGVAGKLTAKGPKAVKPVEAALEAAKKGEPLAAGHEDKIKSLLKDVKLPEADPMQPLIPRLKVIEEADAGLMSDQISKAQKLQHPGLDIPAPFKTVEERIEPGKQVPAEVTDIKTSNLARLRAIKASILQRGNYKIDKYTVDQLLDIIRRSEPDHPRRKVVEGLIDKEAKRVFGDIQKGGKFPTKTKMYTEKGELGALALTLDQFSDLIRKGEIAKNLEKYGPDTDAAVAKFPIHSPEDLDHVFMNNARGERVSMREYLQGLGVKLKVVDPTDFDRRPVPSFNMGEKAVPAVRKVERALADPEAATWISQVKGTLSDEEIAYLRGAGSRKDYDKRLGELKTKTVAGDFKSLDDFIAAAKVGAIPGLNQILKNVGVKSVEELRSKAKKIIEKTGEVPPAMAAATVPEPNAKVKRVLGMTDPDDFGPKVTSAEDIVKSGTTVEKELPQVSPEQLEDLAKALPFAVVENLVDPADMAKYPFLTKYKKAKRTDPTPGGGRARNIHGWNQWSQSDIFRKLVLTAGKRHGVAKGLKGKEAYRAWHARSVAMYDEVMPELAVAEAALRREGVKLISGSDNAGIMLSLHDVLSSMPRQLIEKHLFQPAISIKPTEWMEAADSIVKALMGPPYHDLGIGKANAESIIKNSARIKLRKDGDKIVQSIVDGLVDNAELILQKAEVNYAAHGTEVGKYVKSMSDDVIKNVVTKYANPDISIGEVFGDFMRRHNDIAQAGRQQHAPTDAYKSARQKTDITLATVLKPGDFAEAEAAAKYKDGLTKKEAAKLGTKHTESRSAETMSLMDDTVDLGDRYQWQFTGNLFRANVPMMDKIYMYKDALGRGFVADYGHGNLHTLLRTERSVTQDFSRAHRSLIASLHDSITQVAGPNAKTYTQEAFKHLQEGTKIADPAVASIMKGMESSLAMTFGSSVDSLGSFAQRNGIFADHLNEIMDYYGVPGKYRFDPSVPFTKQTEAWKKWEDVEDPLALMDQVFASMQRASVEVTLARDFTAQWGKKGPQPGFVKVTDKQGVSKVGQFIDQDLVYPKEIVEQLKYLDDLLKGSITKNGSANSAAMLKRYDSIIHAWKSGLTIYRPGHHVRNLIGDVTLGFFDGVTNPAVYAKSTRILKGRSKQYQGWDGLKALMEGNPLAGAKEGGTTGIRINGKKVAVSDDTLYRAAYDQGIIPDYRTLEDIAFNATQQMPSRSNASWLSPDRKLTRPTGGRAQKLAGGVSQARDHWVRIAHFVDVLEKGKFKNLDEAYAAAGARVRKWHPDGSDLTNFEGNVMRRTFMFYSWMRKAIPLVLETLVMKPGKAIMFPKAMYNLAEMQGVDLESLSNPFPVDQLFPEFITDQVLGPQFGEAGDYSGVNPGEPITELLSQYGSSDPQHPVLGALSPVMRIPAELATGTSMGTGTPIRDKSDYVDSQIPNVGALARISGHSVTGAGAPIDDVARGNTEAGLNETALQNFLTGIGVRDYSKPSYIRRAQIEKRNAAGEMRRNG